MGFVDRWTDGRMGGWMEGADNQLEYVTFIVILYKKINKELHVLFMNLIVIRYSPGGFC